MKRIVSFLLLAVPLMGIGQQVKTASTSVKIGAESSFLVSVGRSAPKFTLADQHGKMVRLTDFRGRYILLNFWESNSASSRAAQTKIQALYKEFNSSGKLAIVSVARNQHKENWLKALEENKTPWVQLMDVNDTTSSVARLYRVGKMPVSYLIAPDGKVIADQPDRKLVSEKLSPRKITPLDGLSINTVSQVLAADGIAVQDFSEDLESFNTILKTDIGEAVLSAEMQNLVYPRDKDAIYNLLLQKASPLASKKRKMTQQFVATHPDSYLSLYYLAEKQNEYTVDGYAKAYQQLSERLKGTKLAAKIKSEVEKANSTPTGITAADFTRKNHQGKTVSLSDYRGKLVILDFWGSWCKPCREANIHLKTLYEKYKDKGLEIVSVAVETGKTLAEKQASWLKAIKEDDINWVHVLNEEGVKDGNLAAQYKVQGYPTKILLDQNGKILMRATSDLNDEITERVMQLLK